MQSTSKLVMVRPDYFGPNNQTALTNVFQKKSGNRANCHSEWHAMRQTLTDSGVDIVEFQAIENAPDAIFPNWFTTYRDKTLDLFAMEAPNRKIERNNPSLTKLLSKYHIDIDFAEEELKGIALESTSSLVMDRINNIAYCSISSRSNLDLAKDWSKKKGFELVSFSSSFADKPIYHTNVVMWIGTSIAGICLDVIHPQDLNLVKNKIEQNRRIINFSKTQLEAFCGNMLEVQNKNNELLLLMSKSANSVLSKEQLLILNEYYSKLLVVDLDNIEKIGGGSARCMVQELY
ncbi:MAG: arginine deiminase-related protein [Gammaproteobacteria bacterium]